MFVTGRQWISTKRRPSTARLPIGNPPTPGLPRAGHFVDEKETMGASRHQVIQWATGNTGQRSLREVIRDPALDLVGVRVYVSAKEGVDAGELCGEQERHVRNQRAHIVNSMTVFEFDADAKVRRLTVYLRQPR